LTQQSTPNCSAHIPHAIWSSQTGLMKTSVIWVMILCKLVHSYKRFIEEPAAIFKGVLSKVLRQKKYLHTNPHSTLPHKIEI